MEQNELDFFFGRGTVDTAQRSKKENPTEVELHL